ncbi:hypothetical protein R50073_17340 [Maricurvus nonylphenolicus]|uniref:hypothetical protein n=1 Tax=Maricurvus nonylphenolicus TaxID=1008307 RepID=UPI0036F2DA04
MHFPLRFLSSLIFAFSLSAVALSDSQRSLRYIDGEGLSPIVYKNEEGKVLGIVPESVYLVFDALGIKLNASLVPDARVPFELINGRAEVSTAILYGDLELEDFPKPMTICPTAMLSISVNTIWHRDGSFTEEQMQSLEKIRIGMLNQSPGLKDASGLSYEHLTSFNSVDAMMKALMSQRVDTILMNWSHAQLTAEKLGRSDMIKKGPSIADVHIHLALLTQAFSPDVIARACEQVVRFKSKGAFQRIFSAYFN